MGLRLFNGLRPQCLRGALRNALGGVTQVSMNILQVLGNMRIAGTPVVTGLYTVFLPLVAFAVVGSSRHLVVAADSATTPNFVSGLSGMAATESAHYMDLVAVVALLTAGLLLLARIFRLGFLADSLLCTVLVGLLTGVGVQVGIAMLGGLLGIAVGSPHTVGQFWELLPPQVHLSPLYPAVLVVGLLLAAPSPRRGCLPDGERVPQTGAVCWRGAHVRGSRHPAARRGRHSHRPHWVRLRHGANHPAASFACDFLGIGIATLGPVPGGLPHFALPAVTWDELLRLVPIARSGFVIIIAQSAVTAGSFGARHHEWVDEDADILGPSAANRAAVLSAALVVNGSPTQTATESNARRTTARTITKVANARRLRCPWVCVGLRPDSSARDCLHGCAGLKSGPQRCGHGRRARN